MPDDDRPTPSGSGRRGGGVVRRYTAHGMWPSWKLFGIFFDAGEDEVGGVLSGVGDGIIGAISAEEFS